MGDRYDIAGLRALAEDKFEDCLNSDHKAMPFSKYEAGDKILPHPPPK
jgi:hypothetical protein